MTIKPISMHELHEKTKSLGPNELVLDIRTPEEYVEGHVPGSRNISHELVADHAEELSKYKKFYMYCHSGGRVGYASQELLARGIENFEPVLSGGMPDWIASGYPTER